MFRIVVGIVTSVVVVTSAWAQRPQPFPRPSAPEQPSLPSAPPPETSTAGPAAPATANTPSSATLGFPIYPAAQFIASYDAGRGQRYYIFGATASFADLIAYYRNVLGARGDQVFKQPPTHMFRVGRFRNNTMAFPPGVTIKDWRWSGSQGYPNPTPGAQPARFPTIIMMVPAPPTRR